MLKIDIQEDNVVNFTLDQGETLDQTFFWKDAALDKVSLAGYTARMQLRTSFDAEDFVLEMTTENGRIELIDPGEIRWIVDAETTAAIPVATYKYDMELVNAGGKVKKFLKGKFKFVAEVTKEVT